jgi:uncharacterized protein (TIGR02421 family)
VKTPDRARYAAVRDAALAALDRGVGGRWELPGGGLLHIERPLPFLVIGRLGSDDAIARLTGGLASRLVVPVGRAHARGASALVTALVGALAERSRALLVVWLSEGAHEARTERPLLRVRLSESERWSSLEPKLARALAAIPTDGTRALISLERGGPDARGGLRVEPHLSERVCEIDLAVFPRHRDATGAARYPLRLLSASRAIGWGIAHAADAFTEHELKRVWPRPRLGAATLDPAARRADATLCAADDAFDVLVQLTPAHLDRVWNRLVETDFQEEPQLSYRPLPFDPLLLKRRVLEAPVEAVEDPFVAELLREKQEELDRLLSMLRDRGEVFLHESELVFGRPDGPLIALAERILATPLHGEARDDEPAALSLDAIIERTRAHMHRYREQDPLFPDEIELRDDTAAGMMVLHGRLVLRTDLAVSLERLDALLEHEVGTHVLTWFNGSAQPLRLLGRGLAGYEALQEGLAVLAEHLAGALDPSRLRVLAARVIAADAVAAGASFLAVFHLLHGRYGLGARTAFRITVRAARGGGMTKDFVYLRGLCDVIEYVRSGDSLERLYTGKVALRHLDIVRELVERGMVAAPRVLPMILAEPSAGDHLRAIRASEDGPSVVARMAGSAA